jgi:hypothetical protein
MNYINELVSRYPFLMDLSVFLATLLGVIVTFWVTQQEAKNRAVKERYENLIFPLFDVMEPVLFQDEPTPDIYIEMMRIFTDNRQWADGELLERFHYYRNEPNPSTFHKLCALVDSRYDSCCRQLGMPVRTYDYRLDKKQFESPKAQRKFKARRFSRILLVLFFAVMADFFITLIYEPLFYLGYSPALLLGAMLAVLFLAHKAIIHFC